MTATPRGPAEPLLLDLGGRRFDLARRALVMGILNRTTDSFYDGGAYFRLDDLLLRAERLVADGADLLDVGARAAGVGTRTVSVAEETDLVTSAIEALRGRLEVPLSVDTWRAPVAAAAFEAGAVLGNDMSGFRDPDYLPAAVRAGAAVVATHTRLPPGVPDPEPVYGDVVADVAAALRRLADRAEAAGVPASRILVDPGLDLGKTWQQSLRLLAQFRRFAGLGYPLLLAASNKIFLGRLLDLDHHERDAATVAACALGVSRGARVVRAHDARGTRHAVDLATALQELGG
jgi:dihydropteroate synthase